jgi:DNA polymerase III epsilon subunit-like protein
MKNVMVDIETLGSRNGSEILSIGAVKFDTKVGVGEKFYRELDCSELGMNRDEATLLWWSQQSPEAQRLLTAQREPYLPVLEAFNEFARGMRVWGYGSTFDNMQLRATYAAAGVKEQWGFREDMCFRTLRTLGAKYNLPYVRIGTHHNALDDALTQAVAAVQILNKMEITL